MPVLPLRVAATFLVDGFVRGTWKIEKSNNSEALVVNPFESLTRKSRAALESEAKSLVRFIEADSKTFEVRFQG
jgi:hypothetical protein